MTVGKAIDVARFSTGGIVFALVVAQLAALAMGVEARPAVEWTAGALGAIAGVAATLLR